MTRKGWDALSETYRSRLLRGGVSRSDYESGTPLHKARGHVSQSREAFAKRTARFVSSFGTPADSPDVEMGRIRAMGVRQGTEYIEYRRRMIRLYESGRYREAETMYKQRDKSLQGPDSMWWYHGMFGG